MAAVRLIVIGGFLGAGKTTAIAAMAKLLIADGLKVGVVTNDQGEFLVDTQFLDSEGLSVFEVTGGCFCCNFDQFTQKLNAVSTLELPDVILAEPVGSCTDLIATIFKPILNDYTKSFAMSPLSVVVDPRRALNFIRSGGGSGGAFSNEINYLFDRQLSEADIIALNKCDLLQPEEIQDITAFLESRYKGAKVVAVSALKGDGLRDWYSQAIQSTASASKPSLDIDYDAYARAEAALGWLNTFATVEAAGPVDVNAFVERLIERMRGAIRAAGREIAHLKCYAVTGVDFAKAGVTTADAGSPVGFNRRMEFEADRFNIIVNARVEIGPDELARIARDALDAELAAAGASARELRTDSFAPAYPKPKYRL